VEVALLEAQVVEGIEVIERPDGVTGKEQTLATCEPIKPAPPVTRKFTSRS